MCVTSGFFVEVFVSVFKKLGGHQLLFGGKLKSFLLKKFYIVEAVMFLDLYL